MTPEPKLIIIEPEGPQGPKVAFEVINKKQFRKLDEQVGKLSEKERKTADGLRRAGRTAGLHIVED